jgi:hypothetical protein
VIWNDMIGQNKLEVDESGGKEIGRTYRISFPNTRQLSQRYETRISIAVNISGRPSRFRLSYFSNVLEFEGHTRT